MKQTSYLKEAATAVAIGCIMAACSKNTESAPVRDNGSVTANGIIGTNGTPIDSTDGIIGTNGIIGGGK